MPAGSGEARVDRIWKHIALHSSFQVASLPLASNQDRDVLKGTLAESKQHETRHGWPESEQEHSDKCIYTFLNRERVTKIESMEM